MYYAYTVQKISSFLDQSSIPRALQVCVLFSPYYQYCVEQSACQQYCKMQDRENQVFKAYLAVRFPTCHIDLLGY